MRAVPVLAMIVFASAATAAVGAPRQIAPEMVAPPQVDPGELERQAPRDPLSELGQAAKPRLKVKGRNGDTLFAPLATQAGIFEAAGLTVTIAGLEPVGVDETCRAGGQDWACGMRARTAFRGFLRRRAVTCDLPPDLLAGPVTVACRIGTLDIGNWLVSNGWARALASGPYEEAGETARKATKGIFGPVPDAGGLPLEPAPFSASASDQPVLASPSDAEAPQEQEPDDNQPAPQGLY